MQVWLATLALCIELYKKQIATCFCDYDFLSLEIRYEIELCKEIEKPEQKKNYYYFVKSKRWHNPMGKEASIQ